MERLEWLTQQIGQLLDMPRKSAQVKSEIRRLRVERIRLCTEMLLREERRAI